MGKSIIQDKSKAFALQIVQLYDELTQNKEFVLSKQILRSGTSIGANAAESQGAQSKADFYSKLNISLKEAYETCYWLELLHESGRVTNDTFQSLHGHCNELIRILVAITKNQKVQNIKRDQTEQALDDEYDRD